MSNAALLAQIQQGKRLKKVEVNDRSAPVLQTKGARGGGGGGSGNVGGGSSSVGGGAPQLGSLFAGGIPKLKPTGAPPASKPPLLGKTPAVPKRNVNAGSSSEASSATSTPSRPPPRLPPTHAAPSPGPSAPAIPRRPPVVPPRPRSVSPPPRPATTAPTIPSRAVPPPSKSTPSKPTPTQATIPSLPPRKPPPPPPPPPSSSSSSGRPAPPPPPPRPVSTLKPTTLAAESPVRAAPLAPPAPPSRRSQAQPAGQPVQPPRVRALSAVPPPPPSSRNSAISLPADRLSGSNSSSIPPRASDPTRRTVSISSASPALVNGSRPARIPSPPPSSGTHTFLTSADFPPPRTFTSAGKHYASGNTRGCTFDISLLT